MLHNYDKITQVLNFFARKNANSRIQKLKAIKLIWAADRYHLRKYGRLVSADEYIAMRFGPVASNADNIANNDTMWLSDEVIDEAKQFVTPSSDRKTIYSHKDVNAKLFSKTDLEALEFAWKQFGQYNGFQIADISHDYPEWSKHQDDIELGVQRRKDIDPTDFFENPIKLTQLQKDPFELDDEILKDSKEVYTGAF